MHEPKRKEKKSYRPAVIYACDHEYEFNARGWVLLINYQSITADETDNLTNPHRSRNALHENPHHALPHVPLNIYSS